jgi:hypothetical protein
VPFLFPVRVVPTAGGEMSVNCSAAIWPRLMPILAIFTTKTKPPSANKGFEVLLRGG